MIACIARTLSSQTIPEHHRSFACADSSQTTPQILHLIYISKPAGREKNLGSEAAGSGVESMASCFSYRCSDHWATVSHMISQSLPCNIALLKMEHLKYYTCIIIITMFQHNISCTELLSMHVDCINHACLKTLHLQTCDRYNMHYTCMKLHYITLIRSTEIEYIWERKLWCFHIKYSWGLRHKSVHFHLSCYIVLWSWGSKYKSYDIFLATDIPSQTSERGILSYWT